MAIQDREESYYQYLLTSEISAKRALAHRMITTEYFRNIFRRYDCGNILDVGCGLGFFIANPEHGIRMTGIDSNKKVIEHCRKAGINAFLGDATALPFDGEVHFDGLICSHLLEHLMEPEKAFREFNRVLKQGGILIVRVPPFDSLFYNDWTHVRPFTKKSLYRIAAFHGFKPLSIYYYHYDIPFVNWQNPLFRSLNRMRHMPIIKSLADFLMRLAAGVPAKEVVMIAEKKTG